jgi:lysozyme
VSAGERKPSRAWLVSGAISAAVLAIALREGFRDTAYQPIKGDEVTIGYGTTRYPDGTPVRPGDKVTPERARKLLEDDADATAKGIEQCIGDVPLSKNEWSAYLSFAYNVGVPAFCRSTLVKKLHQNPPDYAGACAELLRWNRAQGRVVQGLTNRRFDEYRQCMGVEHVADG